MYQLWLFFQSGFFHVFNWTAYNHLLFLIILVVACSNSNQWKDWLLAITFFTVSHTLALLLSLYGIISLSEAWVKILVPLLIFIAALYALFTAGKSKWNHKINLLLGLCLVYGIIHGLGFGGYFESISRQVDSRLLATLEYSLGLEVGQFTVALLLLLVSFLFQTLFRFSKKDWTLVTSALAIGLLIPILMENWLW